MERLGEEVGGEGVGAERAVHQVEKKNDGGAEAFRVFVYIWKLRLLLQTRRRWYMK